MKEKNKYFPGLPVIEYLEEAASGKPVPGGGSVAALSAALGASLMEMVANFTVGKEKYAPVEEEVNKILSETTSFRQELVELVQADTEVYGLLSAAFKLPKQTEVEKNTRAHAIQKSLKDACSVPTRIAELCVKLSALCQELAGGGNPNLITDVGVAINLLSAAFKSALLNVEINLKSIKDDEYVLVLKGKINKWREQIVENKKKTNSVIKLKM
ncbi:MAG: cyclodeaminase/cyclohydrolase family protein [bacterium]